MLWYFIIMDMQNFEKLLSVKQPVVAKFKSVCNVLHEGSAGACFESGLEKWLPAEGFLAFCQLLQVAG